MINRNPPLKFVIDLDNFKTSAEMAMMQLPSRPSLEDLSTVNMEIDLENNHVIMSKPGMSFESKSIVKQWYK